MNTGNYSIGKLDVIRFKCTKCGFIDEMERDIASEVLDVKRYKGKRCYYAYCIKCESIMYPEDLMKNNQK